jgi:ABC-2 family transporter protein
MTVLLRLFLRDLGDLARRPALLAVTLGIPVVLLLLIGHLHAREPTIFVAVLEHDRNTIQVAQLRRALDDLASVKVQVWPAGDVRPWERARRQRVDLVAEWIGNAWRLTTPSADRHRAAQVLEVAQDLTLSLRRQDELRARLAELDSLRDMLSAADAASAAARIDVFSQVLRDEAEVPTPVLRALLAGSLHRLHPPATLADHSLVPGYIALITVFLPFLFGATALVRERESGTLPMLLLATGRRWRLVALGKLLLPVAVALVVLLLLLVAARSAFGFGIKPGLGAIVALQTAAALVSALLGLSLSTLVPSSQDAYTASAVYLVASILLTGMVYPVDHSATAVAWVAHTFPLTLSGPPLEAWIAQGADAPPIAVAWAGIAAQGLVAVLICERALRRLEAHL